ncbi:hypothetical protein M2386_003287 [Erwinia rhapontici]|nr:hypothetical protein [Erwinia rhapontici]MCS3608322.1 hypothetical protein [Erwinia rhapontici]
MSDYSAVKMRWLAGAKLTTADEKVTINDEKKGAGD